MYKGNRETRKQGNGKDTKIFYVCIYVYIK